MYDTDPIYTIREQTGYSEHPSVDDVIELVLKRAQNPREDHHDAHLDEAMAAVVDRYGEDPVRTLIHRVLVEHYPFRTATVDLEMRNIDGVRIGTTAGWFLEELNVDQDS